MRLREYLSLEIISNEGNQSMTSDAVLLEVEDYIAQITLNRPENRNSITPELMASFSKVLNKVKERKDLRCLIIAGSGKSFCAGGDFGGNSDSLDMAAEPGMHHESLLSTYRSFLDIARLDIPVIGALTGHAIGGGFGLALICDIRVANKDALYGANFARLGLHSGMSISYMLPRLVGIPRAAELLFTGRRIDGSTAESFGMMNYAVAEDQVLEKSWKLAREIAVCAPVAVRMMKRSLLKNGDWDPDSAAFTEAICQAKTFEMRDSKEGIRALLEKREPRFIGQ